MEADRLAVFWNLWLWILLLRDASMKGDLSVFFEILLNLIQRLGYVSVPTSK